MNFYVNNGTTRAVHVPGSVQLLLCTVPVPQFTQEQAVSTTRQSTTMSSVENAIYTTSTIMEVAYSCQCILGNNNFDELSLLATCCIFM